MDQAIITDADMLAKVDAFCESHGMAPTTFGRLAAGDGSLVPNLRAGRSLTLKLANKVVDFMAEYRLEAAKPSEAA